MLRINLLTERRDAENYYRRWKLGDVCVDWLVMHLDRTVRRRVHQELRIIKKYNERVRNRVVRDDPSYALTMVKKRIKTRFTDGQGDCKSLEVIRAEPMRLFPSPKKERGKGSACPKGKDLGLSTPVPEPTPIAFEYHKVIGPRSIEGKGLPRHVPRRKTTVRQLIKDSQGVDQLA